VNPLQYKAKLQEIVLLSSISYGSMIFILPVLSNPYSSENVKEYDVMALIVVFATLVLLSEMEQGDVAI